MILLNLILATFLFAQQKVALSSTDIKSLIETRNTRVIGQQHRTEAMSYREGHLKRSFLPTLYLRTAQERFKLGDVAARTQPDYGAELSLNLFNGMKDKLSGDLIKRKSDRMKAEQKVTLYEEIIRAKEIYWHLIFLGEKTALLDEMLTLNKTNLKSANRRIQGGVATRADQFEFEMKETEIKREKELSLMQSRILTRELTYLLGYAENTLLELTEKLEHQHEMQNQLKHSEAEHAFLAKPALIQADENEVAAKIVSRNWWPKLDAYVAQNQYNVRNGNVFDAQEGRETVLGLRLTMNVFDYFNGNREAAALMQEAVAAKTDAQYLEKQIENEAHSEIAELQFLHGQVHEAEESIKKANTYLKLTLSEYSRGVKNSPDVLGATEKVAAVKSKYFEILRDFQITREHLLTKSNI